MKLMDFYEKFYKEEMEAAERQLYVTNSEPEVANESEHIEEEESSNGIIDEESSIITGGRYMAMDDLGKRYVCTYVKMNNVPFVDFMEKIFEEFIFDLIQNPGLGMEMSV